MLEFS